MSNEVVKQYLGALGAAYRGDWSGIDGRTLRGQLDEVVGLLDRHHSYTYEQLCHENGICPVGRCWHEYCPEPVDHRCSHQTAFYASWLLKTATGRAAGRVQP